MHKYILYVEGEGGVRVCWALIIGTRHLSSMITSCMQQQQQKGDFFEALQVWLCYQLKMPEKKGKTVVQYKATNINGTIMSTIVRYYDNVNHCMVL